MASEDIKKRRISLDLDAGLISGVDEMAGRVNESRNAFITTAIASRLRVERRARTDAAFAEMASDTEHQEMLVAEERGWAPASDEAWRTIDEDNASNEPARPVKKRVTRTPARERRAAR